MAIGLVVLLYGGVFGWLAMSGDPQESPAVQMAQRIPMGQAVILSEKTAPPENGADNGSQQQHTPPDNATTAAQTPDQTPPDQTGLDSPSTQATQDANQSPDQAQDHTASQTSDGAGSEQSIRDYLKKPAYSPEVQPLSGDPEPGLMESTSDGILPIIGKDGKLPWQVYSRPFDTRDPRPRIAIVLTGMGLNSMVSKAAIKDMPGEVSLAVSPYADNVQNWVNRARSRGHEVLMHVPMEPDTYPMDDPGPHTLLTGVEPQTNIDRLHWVMSRATGYAGLVNFMGTRFTEDQSAIQPVLTEMLKRGVYFLDNNTADDSQVSTVAARLNMPLSVNSVVIDDIPTAKRIDDMLGEVTRIARRDGQVVAMAAAYPITLERLKKWIETLQARGYVLAPVSATVAKGGAIVFNAPGN